MDVTVLCRVVDNFGDIGFVYRLCRSLSALDSSLSLRIVTDNLRSFSLLNPHVKEDIAIQSVGAWKVLDWNKADECLNDFLQKDAELVLECFQCGRPEWLDEILFSPERKNIVRIINIDYLTAEAWADDFHLLKSGTRSPLVKKINFFPGFTKKTGGMILDEPFVSFAKNRKTAQGALRGFLDEGMIDALNKKNQGSSILNVLMFSYPRDFSDVVKSLSELKKEVHVFLAGGAGHDSFFAAWEKSGKPFFLHELPFLPQEKWDALMCLTDFSFIRGEDSFSRACLIGTPFIWHAYEQKDNVHFEKVNAFLCRLEEYSPCMPKEALLLYKKIMLSYNTRTEKTPGEKEEFSTVLFELLNKTEGLKKHFMEFSAALTANGSLTSALLKLMREF